MNNHAKTKPDLSFLDSIKDTNKKWYQSAKATPAVNIEMAKMGVSVISIYECLVHCSSKIGACIISRNTLAKAIKVSTRTVDRDLLKLSQRGLLCILDVGGGTKVYVVNPEIIWRKAKVQKKYYLNLFNFPVNVVTNPNNKGIIKITKDLDIAKKNSSRSFNISNIQEERVNNKIYKFKNGKTTHVKKDKVALRAKRHEHIKAIKAKLRKSKRIAKKLKRKKDKNLQQEKAFKKILAEQK